MTLVEELETLAECVQRGLVTQQEYDERKRTMLSNLQSEPRGRGNRAKGKKRPRSHSRQNITHHGDEEDMNEEEERESEMVDAMTGQMAADQLPKARELMPIERVGLGVRDDGYDMYYGWRRHCPWHHRDDLPRSAVPFGVKSVPQWLNDWNSQHPFAVLTQVPLENDDVDLRTLASDKAVVSFTANYTSRLLHAIISLNKPTMLEVPRTPYVSKIILPQHVSCVRSDVALDGGVNGGLAGCAECVLWWLSSNGDMLSFDKQILELAALIGEMTKPGGDNQQVYCGIATPYTEPMMLNASGKRKIQDAVRYGMASEQVKHVNIEDEVDETMLQRVKCYRQQQMSDGDGDDGLIPIERQPQKTYAAGQDEATPSAQISGLIDVYLFKDIVQGRGAINDVQLIKVDMIRLRAKVPGVDPLILLRDLATQNDQVHKIIFDLLKHMADVLQMDVDAASQMSSAFGTPHAYAARLCCEAALPMAVFKFAHLCNITDVHFGGLRIDVTDKEENAMWHAYLGDVQAVRVEHFCKVQGRVTRDLQRYGIHKARCPEPFTLDFYAGIHYRSVWTSTLEEMIHDVLADRPSALKNSMQWLERQYNYESRTFLCDGRPWARNTGVWLMLAMEAFPCYEKKKARAEILQPLKVAPIVEIYLVNKCEVKDPLEVAWTTDFVPDLSWIYQQNNALPDALSRLRTEVIDLAVSKKAMQVDPKQARWDDLYQLYGRTQHSMHNVLYNADLFVPIHTLMERRRAAIESGIKSALMLMLMGELQHWQAAARSVVDLQTQSQRNAQLFAAEYNRFEEVHRDVRENNDVMLNETNGLALFSQFSDIGLGLEIAWQNNNLSDLLTRSFWANFAYSCKCWGMPLKVADGGSAFEVLVKPTFNMRMKKTRATITTKKMGAGIDSTVDTLCSCNNAWGKYMVLDEEARRFYNDDKAMDTRNARTSGVALATVRGCGLARTANGEVNDDEAVHKTQAGTAVFRTEHNKHQTESENSKNFMADLEVSLADSGAGGDGKNIVDEVWSTTYSGKQRTYEKFLSAPVLVIAGNRQDKKMPESTFGGGRMQAVISGTLDGAIGVVARSEVVSNEVLTYREMVEGLESVLGSEDRVPMKECDRAATEQHPRWLLILHFTRKLCFLLRTLTVPVRYSDYELKTSFVAMASGLRGLICFSQKTMFTGKVEFDRNAGGPWWSVNASGTHAMQLAEFTLARAVRSNARAPDLKGAVFDVVCAMKYVPVSITAKLSSAYLWLTTQILDPNQMILYSYMMHTCNFINKSCSIRVLARVIRGLPISNEDMVAYERFCEWLLPLCTVGSARARDPCDRAPVDICSRGCVRLPNEETVEKWMNFVNERETMQAHFTDRNCGPNSAESTYVRGTVFRTVVRPKFFPDPNQAKFGHARDEYIFNTPNKFFAQLYASHQTKEEDDRRKASGQTGHNHNTGLFWSAAHDGCRLPKMGKQRQDDNEIVYDSVHETGHWFDETIRTMGTMQPLIVEFLMLCGLGTNTTHEQLLMGILDLYFMKKDIDAQIINNKDWKAPVTNDPVFKWHTSPIWNRHAKRCDGIEIALAMKLVSFIIVQSFVTQDWVANSIVHTRNLGQWSLDMMSIFLHNHVDKASIPAVCGGGDLPLPHRSPFMNRTNNVHKVIASCARLWYDEELHVDSGSSTSNMLSLTDRYAKNFKVYNLEDGTRTMFYKRMEKTRKRGLPTHSDEFFPFPPESVAHMQAHYVTQSTVLTRWLREATDSNAPQKAEGEVPMEDSKFEPSTDMDTEQLSAKRKALANSESCKSQRSDENTSPQKQQILTPSPSKESDSTSRKLDMSCTFNALIIAMKAFGQSVSSEAVRHIPATLTQCMKFREIPCVTYKNGYCFVLRSSDSAQTMSIVSIELTHQQNGITDLSTFSPLPLVGRTSFEKHRLGDMMCFGLAVVNNEGDLELQLSHANDKTEPFYMFPAINWNHLMMLAPSDMLIYGTITSQCSESGCTGCAKCQAWPGDEFWWVCQEDDHGDLLLEVPDTLCRTKHKLVPIPENYIVVVEIDNEPVWTITLCKDTRYWDASTTFTSPEDCSVVLGMVKPHANNQFLQDGKHVVSWYDVFGNACRTWSFEMDFVTVGQSIVREGQMLFLKLHAIYRDLVDANLRVRSDDLHDNLLSLDEEAWLEVFYVLGHDAEHVHLALTTDELTIISVPLIVRHDRRDVCVLDAVLCQGRVISSLHRTGRVCDAGCVALCSTRSLSS